ncbi:MAG: FixH family protein [Hyphomicrobium sp.]
MNAAQQPGGLSGRHVLASMLAFFAVIIAADTVMIYKAVTTFGGVDNTNAYRDGLAYNTRIARARQQAELGWQATVDAPVSPPRVRVALRDVAGNAISGLRVEATLGRPATVRADTALSLIEDTPGSIEAPHPQDAEAGAWHASVREFRAGDDAVEPLYQTRRRLWVSP